GRRPSIHAQPLRRQLPLHGGLRAMRAPCIRRRQGLRDHVAAVLGCHDGLRQPCSWLQPALPCKPRGVQGGAAAIFQQHEPPSCSPDQREPLLRRRMERVERAGSSGTRRNPCVRLLAGSAAC
ncbi:unnamed protein product, partial [Symbiodinium sp. KB8]